MIKYKLNCKNCEYIFDSWFASSKEFEKLKKMSLINCNKCKSLKIEKSIMSPSIAHNVSSKKSNSSLKSVEVKTKIKEFQTYIKKNFDYVGENFAYEARSIHYENKKNNKSKKGIYGNASEKDIKELKEEGIETAYIPWVNDKEN
tara:strand:- start:2340 stop:2774 length:435 start_codon:yes stop_codon:yes gene_type:complete